jgi:hypothetical protein
MNDYLLGPFADLRRFARGLAAKPPPTRVLAPTDIAAARARLTAAGCDLAHCTENNLHTATIPLPADSLFDKVAAWELWPRSAFIPCPRLDARGDQWLSYRLYKVLPIVMMKLKTSARPQHIIYDLTWGVGAGGYHAFLFGQGAGEATIFSIFTTFAPTRLFLEGLHDQMNYDILRSRVGGPAP